MPKRSKKKNPSTPARRAGNGAKTHLYRYLERQPRPGYSRTHYCAFCGKEGLAWHATREAALLFCDSVCFGLYRHHLLHPLYAYQPVA